MTMKSAHAQFTVWNHTGRKVFVAMGHFQNARWVSRGWFAIDTAECAVTIAGPLNSRHYAYHAHTAEGKFEWGTGTTLCVTDLAFTLSGPCFTGARGEDFEQVDIGEGFSTS